MPAPQGRRADGARGATTRAAQGSGCWALQEQGGGGAGRHNPDLTATPTVLPVLFPGVTQARGEEKLHFIRCNRNSCFPGSTGRTGSTCCRGGSGETWRLAGRLSRGLVWRRVPARGVCHGAVPGTSTCVPAREGGGGSRSPTRLTAPRTPTGKQTPCSDRKGVRAPDANRARSHPDGAARGSLTPP